jgi:hypothetical protein
MLAQYSFDQFITNSRNENMANEKLIHPLIPILSNLFQSVLLSLIRIAFLFLLCRINMSTTTTTTPTTSTQTPISTLKGDLTTYQQQLTDLQTTLTQLLLSPLATTTSPSPESILSTTLEVTNRG